MTLFEEGLLQDARLAYVELLRTTPSLECAQEGVRQVARERGVNPDFELGLAYEAAGRYQEARTLYVEALRTDPTWTEARDALARVQQSPSSESDDPLAAARALARVGDDAAAAESLREAVKENPEVEVPQDLEYLVGGKPEPWRQIKLFVGRWWQFASVLLVVVLVAGYLILRRYGGTYLDIQDFDKGTTEKDIGKGLHARVEEELAKLNDHGQRQQVSMVSGPIQKDTFLADLTPLAPQVALFSTLIDRLMPQRVVTVTGYLHGSTDRGDGITLSIAKDQSGRIVFTKTIWESEFLPRGAKVTTDAAEPYRELLEPAAIWILYHLHRLSEGPEPKKGKGFYRLGATDWLGYALFRAGVRQAVEGRADAARELYREALERDSHNRGALFNLGYLESASDQEESYTQALELLQKAKRGAKAAGSWYVEPVWYTATYLIAAIQHYRGDLPESEQTAHEVLTNSKEVLEQLKNPRPWWSPGRIFRRRPWEPTLLVTLFRAERRRLKESEGAQLLRFLEPFGRMALVLYGAALASQKLQDPEKVEVEAETRHKIRELAASEERSPRLSYNLACYYSVLADHSREHRRQARHYELALEQLERAFKDGGSFVDQATDDPSLRGVREHQQTRKHFGALLKKYRVRGEAESSDDLPLSGLAIIGESHARLLKKKGVASGADLIRRARTPADRESLARELDVNPALLERWALLADLMRVPDIDASDASLLEWAHVDSLKALKRSDAEHLTPLLDQLNQARAFVKEPLKFDEVRRWIEEAGRIEPEVQIKVASRLKRSLAYARKTVRSLLL